MEGCSERRRAIHNGRKGLSRQARDNWSSGKESETGTRKGANSPKWMWTPQQPKDRSEIRRRPPRNLTAKCFRQVFRLNIPTGPGRTTKRAIYRFVGVASWGRHPNARNNFTIKYKELTRSQRIWRRERDSNPRDGSPPTHFPGVRLRPLGHLSAYPSVGKYPAMPAAVKAVALPLEADDDASEFTGPDRAAL